MSSQPITLALERAARGEEGAHEVLWELVYPELKRMASARIARRRPGETLQATALVHEAWMRLGVEDRPGWEGRAHFLGAAARSMRNIIVDQARRRQRRGGDGGEELPIDFGEVSAAAGADRLDMLALDEALTALEAQFERPARVVMLRFFAGLELGEIAELIHVNRRTVDRDWLFARTWLRRFLDRGAVDELEEGGDAVRGRAGGA